MKLYILLLRSAVNVSKKSKLECFEAINKTNCEGLKNIHNECDFCHQPLLTVESLDNYLQKV